MKAPSKAKTNPFLPALVFFILCTPSLYAQTTPNVNLEPIEKWIEKHRNLKSLYVEFVQERKWKALKKTTSTPGKIWMAESGKLFRMQTGDPPRSVVVKKDGLTTIINTKMKTAEIIGADGKAGGRAAKMEEMFQHLFPKSMADLQEMFHIVSVNKEGEDWMVVMEPKHADTKKFLNQFMLNISKDGDTLLGFSLHLKGQSVVTSRTSKSMKNPKVDSGVFTPSLSGYKIRK